MLFFKGGMNGHQTSVMTKKKNRNLKHKLGIILDFL